MAKMAPKLTERSKNNRNVPRCIVPRYNYARMSAVRASRIVRTRYFNENWLRPRLLSTASPEVLGSRITRGARARARA